MCQMMRQNGHKCAKTLQDETRPRHILEYGHYFSLGDLDPRGNDVVA